MKSLNSFSSLLIISLLITIKTLSVNCQSEYIHPVLPQAAALVAESFTSETALPTVTVRGFLNFRTTVDGTVIVFTPASAAATAGPTEITPTSPPSVQPSRIEVTSSPPKVSEIKPTSASSRFDVKPTVFSPSPSFNDKVSSEPVNSGAQYPTGLVTVLGGTVVLNGATTVHETKVIGTYINGKYAQILKSTSHVKSEPISSTRPTEIKPSASVSVIPSARPRPSRDSLKSESSESVRRVRPLKVLESSKKEDEPKETEGGNSENVKENKVQLRRPTRIGTRLTYAPRENPRIRLNRFKVKVAASSTASPTSREKVEEEAAKEINQRFQKRLGIGRPGSSLNSSYRRSRNEEKPSTPPPAPREEETRDTEPQSLGNDHGPELSSGSYSPPLFDQNDPLSGPIEPSAPLKQVQTVTSEITHHINGSPVKVDTVTLVSTIDEPINPSARLLIAGDEGGLIEPTEPLPLNGNEVTGGLEFPPVVLSRTYDLTEHVSRTTVVPVFDGTASANHTITESFVIRKLITAYKTMPFGDSALLATASAEMANGTAVLDGLEASAQNLEPSLLGGSIELTSLPEDGALINGKATSALLSAAGLQTLDPSTGFGQNGFNSPSGQNLPPFDLSNPLVVGAALRNPALAAMYLGLQNYHNQQPDQPQYETITRPTEVILHETVYNTKVLSFYDGRATRTRTITEPASTIDKTITTVTTQVTPRLNTVDLLAAAQAQQFQRLLATQLLQPNGPQLRASVQPNLGGFPGYNLPLQQPNFNGNNFLAGQIQSQQLQHAQAQQHQQQQQQQNQQIANNLNQLAFNRFAQPQIQPSTITHTYTTVTDATSTQSKIYTLKYNAFSTKYRTVTSTSVYPTTVTTTSTIVVQPSLGPAFNPFFG